MSDPVQVAIDLRWRLVRDVLLDPFAWVGGVVIGLVVARTGAVIDGPAIAATAPLAASLLTLAVAVLGADALLFETKENELLRTQPLGPRGLLTVRTEELGWWMHPPALLAGAFAFGAAGFLPAVAAWLAARLGLPLGVLAALRLRTRGRSRGAPLAATVLTISAAGVLAASGLENGLETWALAGIGAGPLVLLGLLSRSAVDRAWDARYEPMASEALAAPSRPRARLWLAGTWLPLPAAVRARLLRDTLLLLRGRDGRGALLLLLAPLSVFAIELEPTPTAGQLLWRTLSAAAMGGGAIAYAVGPGIHRLRVAVMPWTRTAPQPGRRALVSGLLWGAGLAIAHSAWILLFVGMARDGWFRADLPALVGPVLGLELAMVHFSVAFTLSRAAGRKLVGEGMLIFALPAVAVGVALAGVLEPRVIPLYFVLTAPMMANAVRRIEEIEVTW